MIATTVTSRSALGVLLLVLSLPCLAAGVPLAGHWQLDEDASDEASDVLDGKLRRSRVVFSVGDDGTRPRTGPETAQQQYWDEVQKARERRSKRDLSRIGTAYPLVTASRLDIDSGTREWQFVYDDLLPRAVRPNPGGRVYSASGEELVADSIGHTLTYWDNDVLVLETQPPHGGRYVERLRLLDASRLEYRTELDLRVLTEPVVIKRVYARAAD